MVGALNITRTSEQPSFSDDEVEVVERFATMAALAYDSVRQRDVLRAEAKSEGLTGLLNHRGSQERLRAALDDAGAGPVSVVVLDLDHFKKIDDRYGHAEGDRVLAAAGHRLRAVVREADAVGRLAGEEFVLVLPGMEAADAREAAERARAAVAEVSVGGQPLECSAGVAAHPADAVGAAELLAAADAALYAAKDGGRRRTCRYRAHLARRPSPGEERGEIEALLQRRDAIVPFFQPVLELTTGRVSGYEALARFQTETPRPPDEWFAQAHRVGLGAELETAAVAAAFAASGRPAGTFLAVNVSPRALVSATLMDALLDDLAAVVIELTEHDLFAADDTLAQRLAELRSRGARVALDDAGSGYAGLQQVIRVAPEILKLDRSLVHGAHADPAKVALLEALISFAATTGSVVCGEGIEDLADLRVLADLDATYAQGYALARPAADWPELNPGTAAAVAERVEYGVRVAAAATGTWSSRLAELADHLARVSEIAELHSAGRLAASLLDADDVGVMRLRSDGDTVDVVSQHDVDEVGETWRLCDFPATRHLMETGQVGQVVAGDSHGHAAELAELARMGMGAMPIIPAPLGAAGRALVEIYRVRSQAFSRAEIDRARRRGAAAACGSVAALGPSRLIAPPRAFLRAVCAQVHMPPLDGATTWLNSEPLGPDGLRGHVVLVNFWTWTCINWLRQEPYVRAWSQAYRDDGLVVIGAHTPEFSFEHDVDGVRRAIEERAIDYPVVVDNDYAVWDAFANRYWPALYFVDADGVIRDQHFGEGRYEHSERILQELLGVEREIVSVEGTGVEAAADWDNLATPETYLGHWRGDGSSRWALAGAWTIAAEKVALDEAGGSITCQFYARDAHMVLSRAAPEPVPFRVLLDGEAPGQSHGVDTDEDGNGVLEHGRMYQLVRQHGAIGERTLEITFSAPGAEAYSFTFG